jgi:hypothetical protein
MRGQYTLTEDSVSSGGAGTDVLGLIVPANTVVDVNELEIYGLQGTNSPMEFGLYVFTGNTPTLQQPITPKSTDPGNAILASVAVGGRGTGAQAVWSATPLSLQAHPLIGGGMNAYGGRMPWLSSLQRRAAAGGAAAVYLTLRQMSGASGLIGIRFTFSE